MLLRIATTHQPATDLGYLLHKHPDRVQSFDMSFGKVHVFYPEAGEERCEFAMLLDVDAVGLTRGRGRRSKGDRTLAQYVNDRPYVTSSFMSVAIAQVLSTALAGRSKTHAELAESPLDLEARLSALPSRGGPDLIERLFAPLGYAVEASRLPLDAEFPEWGESRFFSVKLTGRLMLMELLRHLYVLIPVLDDYKHYWVSEDEIEKLLSKGTGWLDAHPERELVARRYLRHRRSLTAQALAQLVAEEDPDLPERDSESDEQEAKLERPVRLHQRRLEVVTATLRELGVSSVLDLGCGEGRLLKMLLRETWATRITGADVSVRALEIAGRRLKLDRLPGPVRERIELIHGSVLYADERFSGHDAIVAVEVIEHLDPPRLGAFEEVVFGRARPRHVVVTTPNAEYNALFEGMAPGALRHPDHRFEWTRAQFGQWCEGVGRFGYSHEAHPLGDEAPDVGAPSQMGVFTRVD